jgi:anti-anti-sigma regulatory factor
VSDTVFESSSQAGITEAVVDLARPESAANLLEAAALVEPTRELNHADTPLKLTGEQTIRTADKLRKALADYLDHGLAVVMDLSEVQVSDAAALQLILALRRSAAQREQTFHIKAASQAITETAAALGLRTSSGLRLHGSRGDAA